MQQQQLRMSSRVLVNVMLCCWPSCHGRGRVPRRGNCRCQVHSLHPSVSPLQVSLSPSTSNRSWRILYSFPAREDDTYPPHCLSSVFSLPPSSRILLRKICCHGDPLWSPTLTLCLYLPLEH